MRAIARDLASDLAAAQARRSRARGAPGIGGRCDDAKLHLDLRGCGAAQRHHWRCVEILCRIDDEKRWLRQWSRRRLKLEARRSLRLRVWERLRCRSCDSTRRGRFYAGRDTRLPYGY